MLERCRNPRHSAYPNYGGRGITVCERWRRFEKFFEDMGPRPSPLHSLDRINNDGNYEPFNVRWALPSEQGLNKRDTLRLPAFGETKTMREWADGLGLTVLVIKSRIRRGDSPEMALRAREVVGKRAPLLGYTGTPMSSARSPFWQRATYWPSDGARPGLSRVAMSFRFSTERGLM